MAHGNATHEQSRRVGFVPLPQLPVLTTPRNTPGRLALENAMKSFFINKELSLTALPPAFSNNNNKIELEYLTITGLELKAYGPQPFGWGMSHLTLIIVIGYRFA